MTREEASIIIGNIPINGDGRYSISEYQQAKARAIEALEQKLCEDVVKKDCDKCAYYDNGANNEACDECFADEYEHPNFKPKAQPCNDCISRQAALDINENHHGQMPNHVNHEIWNEIKALPSVTPKKKTCWIPVNERLPEIGIDVLACDIEGIIYMCHRTPHDNYFYAWGCKIKDIIAWIPLPKPYKTESE